MTPFVNIWLEADPDIQSAVGDKIFPNVAPQGTNPDYIVWQSVGGHPEQYLAETTTIDKVRVQIACWSLTPVGANSLANMVRLVMERHGYLADFGTMVHEPDTGRHGYRFDWYIWNTR